MNLVELAKLAQKAQAEMEKGGCQKAFHPSFNEGQFLVHSQEILRLTPGNKVSFILEDLSFREGIFVGLDMEKEMVTFAHLENGEIIFGYAPPCCVHTTVTDNMVKELRQWKGSKPDFIGGGNE